jgi:flagellar assembly factor FliW
VIIETRAFGPIDVLDENIISFNSSLPGFPDSKRFVVISDGAEQQPAADAFCWLQSVDEPQIAFAMLNTLNVYKDYSPVIERDELGELKDAKEEDLSVYNIVVIPDDVTKSTINLKAPVLIDYNKKIGKQVIASNNNYMIRHSIGNSFTG